MTEDKLREKLLKSGEIYLEITSGWVYLPEKLGGFYEEATLRHIANILEELNKELFRNV